MRAHATNVHVSCDEPGCMWILPCEFADIPKYHHVPCPQCGKGEIVSDEDMVAYRVVEMAINVSNDIDPEGKNLVPYAFDTSGLREKATPANPEPCCADCGADLDAMGNCRNECGGRVRG